MSLVKDTLVHTELGEQVSSIHVAPVARARPYSCGVIGRLDDLVHCQAGDSVPILLLFLCPLPLLQAGVKVLSILCCISVTTLKLLLLLLFIYLF